MLGWLVPMWLNSLWHFVVSSASIGTLIGCAAVAVAVFSGNIIVRFAIPDLRKWAIVVAVIAFSFTAVAGKFYHDGLAVKQAQWDAALAKEAERGEAARNDAERTVRDASPDELRDDGWNRDNWKRPGSK